MGLSPQYVSQVEASALQQQQYYQWYQQYSYAYPYSYYYPVVSAPFPAARGTPGPGPLAPCSCHRDLHLPHHGLCVPVGPASLWSPCLLEGTFPRGASLFKDVPPALHSAPLLASSFHSTYCWMGCVYFE